MEKIYIGQKEHTLPYPIKAGFYNSKYHLILLNIPDKEIFNENVFMFTSEGHFLWQIDKAILDRHRLGANEPFVHAQFEIDGQDYKLILSNWGGWKVTLDTKTGKELSYEFTK